MIKGVIFLAVAIVFNGIANILMKQGMSGDGNQTGSLAGTLRHYLTSWPIIIGLGLFALNVIAYTQALSKLPLSVAYPIMVSLTGLIVITGSLIIFKESINLLQWIGFALIIVGVILVAK
ncbi:MAG: EamA family transporter [Deltaproteobacteria bacterium]|nr:EamA family transporter [Deltaproteobacteria bacterium]